MHARLPKLQAHVAHARRQVKVPLPLLVASLAVAAWGGIAFTSSAPIYGPSAIIASILSLAATVAVFVWQPAVGREPVRVIGLMVLVQTFLSGGLSVLRQAERVSGAARPTAEAYNFATVSTVVFAFCFMAGVWAAAPAANRKLPDALAAHSGPSQSTLMLLAVASNVIAIATMAGVGKQLGVVPFILFSSYLMVPLFAAHHLMKGGSRIPLVASILVQLALTLYSSMLGLAAVAVRDVLLTYVAARKRPPWSLAILAVVVFLVLNPAKSLFREHVANSGPVTFEQSLGVWQDSLADTWSDKTMQRTEERDGALKTTTDRLDYNWLSAHVYTIVPDRIPFQAGRTYEDIPLSLVPRVLYPEKPKSNEYTRSRWLVELGVQSPTSIETTAISLPASAEAYWNFGWPGVFSVGFLLGAVVGLLLRIRIADPIGRVAWVTFVASTCTFLLDMVVWMVPQYVIAVMSAVIITAYCGIGRFRARLPATADTTRNKASVGALSE